MPDNSESVPRPQNEKNTGAAAGAQPDAGHMPITEEFDSARWTLPPVVPVVIALVIVGIVVAVILLTVHGTATTKGEITNIVTADEEGSTMVAVQVKIDNLVQTPFIISSTSSELETADGKTYTDMAAPAVDVGRYLQAFPVLGQAAGTPLREKLSVPPRSSFTGMTIFSYPVDKATFDSRKSLVLRVEFADRPPLIMRK